MPSHFANLALLTVTLVAPVSAQDRWHLDRVVFDDGFTASGSFVYEPFAYGDVAISAEGPGGTITYGIPTSFANSGQLSFVEDGSPPDFTGQRVFVAPLFLIGDLVNDVVVDFNLNLEPAGEYTCAAADCGLVLNDPSARELLSGRVLRLGAQWDNLGGSLAGAAGAPALRGEGDLTGGALTTLDISVGAPSATAFWVLGLTSLAAPFKGGVLVPQPDLVTPLTLDATGALAFSFAWPGGVPAGVSTFHQVWVQDASGPVGFSASNALEAVTP